MKSIAELGFADQGQLLNAVNRACEWLWPLPPPTTKSVEVYHVVDDAYASRNYVARDLPHGDAVVMALGLQTKGYSNARVIGPCVKFVSREAGGVCR